MAQQSKDAHAEYMRKWRKLKIQLAVKQARKQGQEDLRITIIRLFRSKLADEEMNGLTAARIIELISLD
jgi:hypothetical protein